LHTNSKLITTDINAIQAVDQTNKPDIENAERNPTWGGMDSK